MKLCRIGELGKEKPAVIDKDNNYKDLSSIINDFDSKTLTFETLEKIKNTDISKLPILKSNERIGACVSKPSKFIGIGLNFKDHAEEQNLPIPKEPIIFSDIVLDRQGFKVYYWTNSLVVVYPMFKVCLIIIIHTAPFSMWKPANLNF